MSQNDVVGQSGLEWYYNRYLQGVDGADRVQVNALGQFTGYLSEHKPIPGQNLKLSLNLNLQKAGQQALQESIDSNPPAPAGAFVAMNPTNGAIYAMGSLPTFNPNIFAKPVSQSVYDQLNNAASGYPLFNRAIQSAYPTGSTFKGITATAALQSGAWSLGDTYDDTGVYSQDGPGDLRHNAGHAAYGVLDLTQAIKVSSDDFFYNLGRLMNSDAPKGGALQQWAHLYGIGRKTGVDLGGENAGILPSPEWRAGQDKLESECVNGTGPFKRYGKRPRMRDRRRPPVVGGRQREPGRRPGRPRGHPAAAGGRLLRDRERRHGRPPAPRARDRFLRRHAGTEDRPARGPPRPDRVPEPRRDPPRAPRGGLRAGGTSADVFANWPQDRYPVYGKTGTAQHLNAARPGVVRLLRARPGQADPGGRDRRAGRLRCDRSGPGGAPDPVAVVLRQARPVRPRAVQNAVSATPIHTTEEVVAPARPRVMFMFDPLLIVAALGLVGCSLVTLKGATRHAVAGHPLYYVDRQAIYAAIGLVIAIVLSSIDYSRLREYRYPMYGLLIALNIIVFGMPQVRGARRWIPLPFLQVQPSEFGKVLLIASLSAFLVNRSDACTSGARPRGSCCWRWSRR